MGVAIEFLAFAADAEIDPEALLADPTLWVPPVGRVDKTIAALSMIVGAVGRDLTDPRWCAAWALVGRAETASQADAAMFAGQQLLGLSGKAKGLTPFHVLMATHAPRTAKLLSKAKGSK